MVFHLYEKIFIQKKRCTSFELTQSDVVLFHLNMIDLAFQQENYPLSKEILSFMKKEFSHPLDFLATTMMKFYDGLLIILLSENVDEGTRLAGSTILILKMCDLNRQAQTHQDDLNHLKKKFDL
ncbi:hypothetical protein [Isobaculum melis]|uniref:Uncharacterized protein n=1 Tax=Isobaculum melis TaxID=142588 RepID=A0A1H9TK04_9LACT|nr:hypothetical protein [Isobaculum melis]SER97377.1 hypothetical protein SAMN04488559_11418 [Isobaculum melis]